MADTVLTGRVPEHDLTDVLRFQAMNLAMLGKLTMGVGLLLSKPPYGSQEQQEIVLEWQRNLNDMLKVNANMIAGFVGQFPKD